VQNRELGVGGDFSMMRVLVISGSGAIEVRIGAVGESTMVVVGHEGRGRNVIPFIGHELDDVGFGDS